MRVNEIMAELNAEVVLEALRAVKDPDLGRDIVSLGFVKDVKTCGDNVSFTIELTTPACPVREQMKEQARQAIASIGAKQIDIKMTSQVRPSPSDQKTKMIPHVKNIIPIASGKGGVGKSTVSANLALALSKLGAKVGLMDADVYGPSIPTIMGAKNPPTKHGDKFTPALQHGIKIISMDFFTPAGDAVIWRGPMLHKAMEQFLGFVDWGELDYLLVDLPPGTGDIQLSLCQMIPLTGAAVVSTPQDVALRIAEKAIIMFNKLRTPVLGVIENMSGFVCGKCGHHDDIFGSGGAKKYSLERGIPFLGGIPLSTLVRKTSDAGLPIVIAEPESAPAMAFMKTAENLAAQVSVQNMGVASNGPIPSEIKRLEDNRIQITWNDGHVSAYTGYSLRVACGCAQCVDEVSGKQILNAATVGKDVHAVNMSPVGRYAVHFQWSDGHSSGIYTFEKLRSLCPCGECGGARSPR